MGYDTALRAYTAKRIEEIDRADILVGIPCHYNQGTVVEQQVEVFEEYKDCLIQIWNQKK
ncbi:MAG TPA: hypothetical protein EYP19_01130 [Desulfobacterales bacterium]|nr:hypothetical protein [Desulfobacterales bacterium]